MTNDSYITYAKCALGLEGFQLGQKEDVPYDITELANGCVRAIDAGDELKKSQYFSALMVRYWHMTTLLYESSKTLPIVKEDTIDWLADAILKALHYRSWLDPNKAISKDKKGAEKCINQCITSMRQWWFKHLNQLKRKGDKYLVSLDDKAYPLSSDDKSMTVLDTLGVNASSDNSCANIIAKALRGSDLLTAIIIDGIANQDSFVETHSESIVTNSFSKRKLSNHLKNLSPRFISNFAYAYGVSEESVTAVSESLKKAKQSEIMSEIDEALYWLKGTIGLCM